MLHLVQLIQISESLAGKTKDFLFHFTFVRDMDSFRFTICGKTRLIILIEFQNNNHFFSHSLCNNYNLT